MNGMTERINQFIAEKQGIESKFEQVGQWVKGIKAKGFSIAPSLLEDLQKKDLKALEEVELAFSIVSKIGKTGVIKPKEGFAIIPIPKKIRFKFEMPEGIDFVELANNSQSLDEVLSKMGMENNQKNRSNISARLSLMRKEGKQIKTFPRGRKPLGK